MAESQQMAEHDRQKLIKEWVVLQHPACLQNPEWFELANRAVEALQELYQRVGAAHLEAEDQGGEGSKA
jgi:hypothetical protein